MPSIFDPFSKFNKLPVRWPSHRKTGDKEGKEMETKDGKKTRMDVKMLETGEDEKTRRHVG